MMTETYQLNTGGKNVQERQDKYFIITYGCQMNVHDSEKIAGMMEENGYIKSVNLEEADIILLNTCIVRENAELKVLGKIGSVKRLKKKNKNLIIAVGGCMMQSSEAVSIIKEKYPQVDLVFGTHNLHRLPKLIENVKNERMRTIEIWDKDKGLIPELPHLRGDKHKAWISIIQGCNNYCTYCIVPYVRGRERSRHPENIIQEIKNLSKEGVKEITLLGQNVNSYGKDLENEIDFADLLMKINNINLIERIRYMTSHPRDFSDKLIYSIKKGSKICEHFHLPVQAGSTSVLNKMNRGYTKEEYLGLIKKIKDSIPDASITTDIIVGFPGETEEDFQETIEVVRTVRFDMAYTFIYSPRTGTPAADIQEQVSEDVKNNRLQRLMKIQNEISLENNQQMKDKIVEVLVDGESKNNPDMLSGRNRNNKLIIFPAEKDIIGKLVNVKINRISSFTLYGEIY